VHFTVLENFLIVLAIALVVTASFRYFKLPVILGYLVVGALVGPHVLGWLPNTDMIKDLAEFGVVLLMFTVGLAFSLPKLLSMRHSVVLLGGAQVIGCVGVTMLIGLWLGITWVSAIVIGAIVAMSSTAIVMKQLSEQQEVHLQHGQHAIGILLFQDLAVIPLLVLIPSLGQINGAPLALVLSWALLKGFVAVLLIIGIGRWCLKPLFHLIVATGQVELFTLSVLFVSIGAAWFTHEFGLSYALGAFVAGIMLGETEFRHQIEAEIRPFRDVLLGLFFISIGMLVNVTVWPTLWIWILLLLVALMLGKSLLIVVLCRVTGVAKKPALQTGIVLAQGGEFGVAILTLALVHRVLPIEWGQSILGALLISFALAPLLIRNNERLAGLIVRG
jgi:K+:H+ antiporter